MRVRPFFWLFLAASCIGVLLFASTMPMHVPATMQVRLDQSVPGAGDITTMKLSITDLEGQPIEEASIFSVAQMTNMDMIAHLISVHYLGQGNYTAQIRLYMAGPWSITVQARADGFDPLYQKLLVQVQ